MTSFLQGRVKVYYKIYSLTYTQKHNEIVCHIYHIFAKTDKSHAILVVPFYMWFLYLKKGAT
jgi:hypothetical protein